MATEQTLNPPVWSFIGRLSSLSSCYGLLWSITLNTDSPIGRMDSRVGMEFSYHLCDNSDKPYIANCTSKFTVTRLMSNNSVFLMEGPLP
jgi:hypothetical protein